MSSITRVFSRPLDFEMVTSMLLIQDTMIIAAKIPNKPWFFSKPFGIFEYSIDSEPHKIFEDYKNIPDMAMVEANSFAFIDQGFWTSSDIHLVKLIVKQEGSHWQRSTIFSTESHCCGICFTDGRFFLTFSGNFSKGYVKMLDSTGTELKTFTGNHEGSILFSNTLCKIYVDPDFRMYVTDVGKQQLTVIKVSAVSWKASIEAENDNIIAQSIIPKRNKELFIAVGGEKNEVVLHSTQGPRKIIRQNELEGTPTALCLVGECLFVATVMGWFSTHARIEVFKDKRGIRREEHVILM